MANIVQLVSDVRIPAENDVEVSTKKSLPRSSRPYVVCVEGNIGSGKSTLMKYFQNSSNVEAVPEPIDKWTDINGHNALGKMYEDPKRWTFSFNQYAFLTRCQMHQTQTDKPVVLLERSLFSLKNCFLENSAKTGDMSGLEHEILCRWFEFIFSTQSIPVDLFVYLKASPENCYKRLLKRNRKEEAVVPMSFIEQLHDAHEAWLIHQKTPVPAPILVLDADVELNAMEYLYEQHRSKILFGHI